MINLVFDIDEVLAYEKVSSQDSAKFFLKKGAILTAIKTNYIFPGVMELMQLLFQTENVRVSFFSSGAKERNDLFVKKLLKIALVDERYKEIKKKVRVLSKEDLVKPKIEETEIQYEKYGLNNGRRKKDISKALQGDDLLENAVLIDDDPTYIAFGQAKNFMKVRYTTNRTFEKLADKTKEPGKFHRSVNRICYIAGMLFKAMSDAEQEGISISDVLFRMQYEQKSDEPRKVYIPRFFEQAKEETIYKLGLEKLREINPELSFITPLNYVQCQKLPVTDEESEFLREALENKDDGCCIM